MKTSIPRFLLVLIVISGLLFNECTKKPSVCFSVNPSFILTGDTVYFSNCSKNAKSYSWNFGDISYASTSVDANPTHVYTKEGTYTITLTEKSKSYYNANSYESTKSIVVIKKILGCMDPHSFSYDSTANKDDGSCKYLGRKTFYFSDANIWFIDLNVDGKYLGADTLCYPTTLPECDAAIGCKKVTLGEGPHTYDGIFYDHVGNVAHQTHGSFTITRDACTLFLLQ